MSFECAWPGISFPTEPAQIWLVVTSQVIAAIIIILKVDPQTFGVFNFHLFKRKRGMLYFTFPLLFYRFYLSVIGTFLWWAVC
jgi:hypothetical protein